VTEPPSRRLPGTGANFRQTPTIPHFLRDREVIAF
jgi:hypothetical protein